MHDCNDTITDFLNSTDMQVRHCESPTAFGGDS